MWSNVIFSFIIHGIIIVLDWYSFSHLVSKHHNLYRGILQEISKSHFFYLFFSQKNQFSNFYVFSKLSFDVEKVDYETGQNRVNLNPVGGWRWLWFSKKIKWRWLFVFNNRYHLNTINHSLLGHYGMTCNCVLFMHKRDDV